MRGVARLDPVSIIIAGALFGGISLLVAYSRKHLTNRRKVSPDQRSIKISDARIYSRYREITDALEEAGIPRGPHETPEEYARRYADELGSPELARLGEIYLYARFRDAVSMDLAKEFDNLEPRLLEAIERMKAPEPANR